MLVRILVRVQQVTISYLTRRGLCGQNLWFFIIYGRVQVTTMRDVELKNDFGPVI